MKISKSIDKMMSRRMNTVKRVLQPSNLPRLFLMLLVLFALYFLYKNYLKEGMTDKDDSETTPSKFNSDISSGSGKKLVLFYAGWCGHCKDLKPTWDSAAMKLNPGSDKSKWKLWKVDVGGTETPSDATSEQSALGQKYKIQGYPTILIFENGKAINEYQGDRSEEGFMKVLS